MLVSVLLMVLVIALVYPPPGDVSVAPGWTAWLFWGGMLSALPTLGMVSRLRSGGPARRAAEHEIITQRRLVTLILACSMAELPAILGVAYYVLTADRQGLSVLTGVSVFLILLMKPTR